MSLAFSPFAHQVLDALDQGVAVFDRDGCLVYANAPARAAMGGLDAAPDGGRLLALLERRGARVKAIRSGGRNEGVAAFLPSTAHADRTTLAERERRAIFEMLEATGWRLTECARRLGISRTTLWRRLKAYGLRRHASR